MLLLYKELEFDSIEVEVFEFAVGIVNNKMKRKALILSNAANILLPGCVHSRFE